MNWPGLGLMGVVALVAGGVFLHRALRRHRQRGEKRVKYREELANIRTALEQFEKMADFDEQIRLLADINRYCSKGFRLFPEQPEIMDITRACDDERRKLAQHWAVAESLRLMKFVEESESLRVKAGRADQVGEALKVASRLLFPHEQITNAMRSVVQYQEALEGLLELPEDQRQAAADGVRSLLDPYFQIIEGLKRENEELARVAWPGQQIRQKLDRLEKV
ncbi:MAG: hypothetical protein HY656_02955 [Acidobacteria bacterium]|nr:hypothetical protein [Acidobacteriota bacterium]